MLLVKYFVRVMREETNVTVVVYVPFCYCDKTDPKKLEGEKGLFQLRGYRNLKQKLRRNAACWLSQAQAQNAFLIHLRTPCLGNGATRRLPSRGSLTDMPRVI